MITPEDFQNLVRDTMYQVDGQTHFDPDVADRLVTNAREGKTVVVPFGKRRAWIAPLLVAAAVVALATTVALATSSRGHTHAAPGTQAPGPRPSTSGAPTAVPGGGCLTAAQALAIVSRERGGTVTLARHSASSFACADGWAYLNFQGPVSPNTATVDLHYVNGKWIIGDRTIACGDGTRPPAMIPALVRNGCGN